MNTVTHVPQIGHMVYFELHDPSRADELVAACNTLLPGADGIIYFSAGKLAPQFAREVNVRDWHVALHLIFRDQAAHDAYQSSPKHQQFAAENKANWKRVRVFDAEINEN